MAAGVVVMHLEAESAFFFTSISLKTRAGRIYIH